MEPCSCRTTAPSLRPPSAAEPRLCFSNLNPETSSRNVLIDTNQRSFHQEAAEEKREIKAPAEEERDDGLPGEPARADRPRR